MAQQSSDLIKGGALFHMPACEGVAQAVEDNTLAAVGVAIIEAQRIDTPIEELGCLDTLASGSCRKDKLILRLAREALAKHGADFSRHVGVAVIPVLGIANENLTTLKADVPPAQRVNFSGAKSAKKCQQAGIVQVP